MKSPRWNDALLTEHRAFVDGPDARAAFDEMVAQVIALLSYQGEPAWRGEIRDFRYLDPVSGERPFSFITNRSDLLFYVRETGKKRVPGGLKDLRRVFNSVTENPRGEWTVRIENAADARKLSEFLFGANRKLRPGTAEISKPIWGDAKYQKRARRALPLLVKLARAGKTTTYGAFARRLQMPNARNLNFVLGCVGSTIDALSKSWGSQIPPIEALVVNQKTGSPGRGVDHFLATLPDDLPADRAERIRIAQKAVFNYSRWDKVLDAVSQSTGYLANGHAAARTENGTAYWWVNHKQTFRHEVMGGYLWSPKKNKGGVNNESYNNMTRAGAGDVVFSFAEAAVRAIGVVQGSATEAPKPTEFGAAGDRWGRIGWRLPVRFELLDNPLSPQEHAAALASVLPEKYAPIQANGHGNQGTYLASVPSAMAEKLTELLGGQVQDVLNVLAETRDVAADAAEQQKIEQRTDIGPTQIRTLVNSRRGQGIYRQNLSQIEKACRVTGLNDPDHLRASHIKPWCECDDKEKLDGYNGLLLSPHIDHLFDRGYISFSDEGELLVSKVLPAAVLSMWGIEHPRDVRPFHPEQRPYLAYHRQHRFKG